MPIVLACPGCGGVPVRGQKRCARCGRAEAARKTEKSRTLGLRSAHWRRVREARLRLDGYVCQLKQGGCTVRATTVHLDPALRGDHRKATLNTTLSACLHCHGVVDAPRATA